MDEELMNIMTEENIEVEDAEIIEAKVTTEDIEYDISTQESFEVVEVETAEEMEIEVEESIGWVGGDYQRHYSLDGRNDPNQHEIKAITGLREELDKIESLQTIYSDKKQQADYYLWRQDENHPLPANPYGLFVSILKDTDKIQICDGESDVFGVTVAEAAFVGNQEYAQADGGTKTGRDGHYCLVAHSGLVAVRRMPSVAVGDYVVPNSRGEAEKSNGDYGYLVTAVSDADGLYAIISLSAPSTLSKKTADSVEDLSEHMTTAEYNITSVTNVANSAYALAQDAKENAEVNSEYLEEKITEVLGRMDAVDGIVGNLSESVSNANTTATLAKTVAEGAVSSAEAIRSEAVATANQATADVKDLIDELSPITEWVDPDNPDNTGAQYFTEYMADGLNTKVDIETFDSKTEEAFSSIERNAKNITSLMSTIDKYSVGEYSQAYGLTHEQAISILEVGYIYVPTIIHTESYGSYSQEFSLGYYYTWNGEEWIPSQSTAVSFSSEYFGGTELTPYWVVTMADVVHDGMTYDLGGLYHWEKVDEEKWGWVKVASTADNTLSRAVSAIKQTANSITAEVSNVKGDVSALDIRVEDTETSITSLTTWQSDASEQMAVIEQKADDAGASIAQVVQSVGEDGEVTAASIVASINSQTGESAINLDANHINFEAENYTIHADHIKFEGDNFEAAMSESINLSVKSELDSMEIGGRNYILNSASLSVSGLGSTAGSLKEYRYIDVGQSYMDIANGTEVVISFDLEMTVNTANPILVVYNDNRLGPKKIMSRRLSFDALVGDTIKQRCSVVTIITDREDATQENNCIEFYSEYGTSNWFKITNLKLEKGNNATGWTPAPEDNVLKDNIITSINLTKEEATINAEKINLNGYVTMQNLKEADGTTIINGGNITTGEIQSDNYVADTSGLKINLDNSTFDSPNFKIFEDGSATFAGEVRAKNLYLSENAITGGALMSESYSEITKDVFYEETIVDTLKKTSVVLKGDYTSLSSGYKTWTCTVKLIIKLDEIPISQITKDNIQFEILDASGSGSFNNTENGYTFAAIGTEDSATFSQSLIIGVTNVIHNPFNPIVEFEASFIAKEFKDGVVDAAVAPDKFTYGVTIKNTIANESGLKIGFYDEPYIFSKNLCIAPSGDAYLNGVIAAKSGAIGRCIISEDGAITSANGNFKVSASGNLVAKNATLSGNITATSGSIGNWEISNGNIVSNNNNIILSPKSDTYLVSVGDDGDPYFRIHSGKYSSTVIDVDASGLAIKPSSDSNYGFLLFSQNNMSVLANRTAAGSMMIIQGDMDTTNVTIRATDVYTHDGGVHTSNKNVKTNIQELSYIYDNFFDSLKPVSYQFIDGYSGRTHTGFIAQDVKNAIEDMDLTTKDFACYCEWEKDDKTIDCGLRYSEFIALCVDQIQKLKKKVQTLDEELSALKTQQSD